MFLSSIKKIDALLRDIKKTTSHLIGKQAFSLLDEGRELFATFCELGCAANQQHITNLKSINNNNNPAAEFVNPTAQLIADNQDWFLLFLTKYPDTISIDDVSFVNATDLKVRSGVQFMFELYKDVEVTDPGSKYNYKSVANKRIRLAEIFDYLKEPLADLDAQIKLSQDNWFNIKNEEIPANMPTTHRWWRL